MSNKLYLYGRGHFTEPEMCSIWQKICISYNSCRYSFVIASVVFNIDRVTTQHTPKCVENCSENKVSYNCPLTRFSVSSVITLKTAFSQPLTNYFVLKRCIPCTQTVTIQ